MNRFIALDVGTKRTGVALVDDSAKVATPLAGIDSPVNSNEFIVAIKKVLEEWEPKGLIFGLPIDLKGKESIAATNMRQVVDDLMIELSKNSASSSLEIYFVDERLTTAQVEKSMKENEVSAKLRKKHRDSLAATLIAQSYIDSL